MRPYGEDWCDWRLNIHGESHLDRRRYKASEHGTLMQIKSIQARKESRLHKRRQRRRARLQACKEIKDQLA